jgi:hypothetical protein
MDKKSHYTAFVIIISVMGFMDWYYTGIFEWYMVPALMGFGYILNPDKFENHELMHRWVIGHSILLPVGLYLMCRPFLDLTVAGNFGLCLLLPVVIHLICDLSYKSGFSLINCWPIKYKMPVKYSYLWIVGNIICGSILCILLDTGIM